MFKKYLLAAGMALAALASVQAQQDLLLSQMPDAWQANQAVNPAFFPKDKRLVIGLPAIGTDLAFSADRLSYNDFFREENGRTLIDFGQAIPNLDDQNTVTVRQRLETVSVGFRLGGTALHVGHAIRTHSSSTFSRQLVELLWSGNAQFIGQEIEIAPDTRTYDWHEIGLGASQRLGRVTLGGRAKWLAGSSLLITDPAANRASIYTNPDVYQLRLTTNYGFHSANIVSSIDTSGFGFDLVTGQLGSQFQPKNGGWAFDVGATFQVTDRLSVHASALDLGGRITYEANYFRSQGSFEFEGATLPGSAIINGDDLDFSTKLDSLNDIFGFQKTPAEYEISLPTRYYAGANFDVTKRLRLAASVYREQGEEVSATAFGVGAHWSPLRLLSVSGMYSVNDQSAANLGVGLSIQPGPVRILLASDNVLNGFSPRGAPRFNLRAGLSIAL